MHPVLILLHVFADPLLAELIGVCSLLPFNGTASDRIMVFETAKRPVSNVSTISFKYPSGTVTVPLHAGTLDVRRSTMFAAVGQAASTPHKDKKVKKNKIPRPMNSFMCFGKEYRKKIQQQHPNLDNKGVSKLLGQQWASLSDDERQVYVDQASNLAEEHKRLYPNWKFTRDTSKKRKTNKGNEPPFKASKIAPATPSFPSNPFQFILPTLQQARALPTLTNAEWNSIKQQRNDQLQAVQMVQSLQANPLPQADDFSSTGYVSRGQPQLNQTALSRPDPVATPQLPAISSPASDNVFKEEFVNHTEDSDLSDALPPYHSLPMSRSEQNTVHEPPAYDPPPDFDNVHRIFSPF